MLTTFPRAMLRRLLAMASRHPRLKRVLVDSLYRLPWIDSLLRNMAHRAVHPDAELDLDPRRMPEGSQATLARIRARMPR